MSDPREQTQRQKRRTEMGHEWPPFHDVLFHGVQIRLTGRLLQIPFWP